MEKLTKYVKLTLVTVGLLSIVPVVSLAQNVGRDMPTFESFDLNGDGTLTESEMNEARDKRVEEKKAEGKMLRNSKNHPEFSKIDTNKDGKVSKEEFTSHQIERRK